MSNRLVSIDVEPGGPASPVGYLGIAELVEGQPGVSWCARFWSPLAGVSWGDWAFRCAADNYEQWAGLTAAAWTQDGDHGDAELGPLSSDCEWGDLPSQDVRVPEWMRSEPTTFGVVADAIERFVGQSPVAAFGASFDVRQLRQFYRAQQRNAPGWTVLDGRQLVRPLGMTHGLDAWRESAADVYTKGGQTLEAVQVRLGIIPVAEAAWRSYQHVRWNVGNKGVLHTAEDDAIANAALFELAMRHQGTTSVEDIENHYALTQYPLEGGTDHGR